MCRELRNFEESKVQPYWAWGSFKHQAAQSVAWKSAQWVDKGADLPTMTETGVQKKVPVLGRSDRQDRMHEHDPGVFGAIF